MVDCVNNIWVEYFSRSCKYFETKKWKKRVRERKKKERFFLTRAKTNFKNYKEKLLVYFIALHYK